MSEDLLGLAYFVGKPGNKHKHIFTVFRKEITPLGAVNIIYKSSKTRSIIPPSVVPDMKPFAIGSRGRDDPQKLQLQLGGASAANQQPRLKGVLGLGPHSI